MVDVDKFTDAELRTKLLEFGFPVMPITGTTRKVMTKKLKLLLENKNKAASTEGRRSLGRYSSEEESDTEVKSKAQKNRRATMAAPVSSSSAKIAKKTVLIEPEVVSSSPKKAIKSTLTTTTTRSSRIVKSARDDFDTGSDSESDIVASSNKVENNDNEESYDDSVQFNKRSSPIKSSSFSRYSPTKSDDLSYTSTRNVSFTSSPSRHSTFGEVGALSGSLASDYAADRLNQIRSRLSLGSNTSAYERPSTYASPSTVNSGARLEDKDTPFLSNFTRKLTALSGTKKGDYDSQNDLVKEQDTNGASYGRSYLANFRATRGREPTYDYKTRRNSNEGKNNLVSYAVLVVAAAFFLILAVVYLGMRSDTSVVTSDRNIYCLLKGDRNLVLEAKIIVSNIILMLIQGYTTPLCDLHDPQHKRGVNCLTEDHAQNAIFLLNSVRPELHKRAVAHKCFDPKIKAHMTEPEIVTFCQTNYAIKDANAIKSDLRNLEVMIFANPVWGLGVAQTDSNNGVVGEQDLAKNMEQVIFNLDKKITSLLLLNPELPYKCTFYNYIASAAYSLALLGIIFVIIFLMRTAFKLYRNYEERLKDEVNVIVEKIIDILQTAAGEDSDSKYVVINHVRDAILSVKDRKGKKKSWEQAVKYINENESRVRTEVQTVHGESFDVWRWIGSANVSIGGIRDFKYRPGRRIVDVDYLVYHVLQFEHLALFFCTSTDVFIKNEVREGFFSIYVLKCRRCLTEASLCSEEPKSELLDVNLALVAGILSLGLDLYQLNELCSATHLPAISGKSFEQYVGEIREIYREESGEGSKLSSTSREERFEEALQEADSSMQDFDAKKTSFLAELAQNIRLIEAQTVEQKDSGLWHSERKKRLTASNFGRICKLRDITNRWNVVNDLLNSNFRGNVYTEYGQLHEAEALKDFQTKTAKKVLKCGLMVHKTHPYLAASPDGLIQNEDALIEVKCPYKAREVASIDEAFDKQLIRCATYEGGALTLKRDDKYYFQVQGQLYVTGRRFCYFVVWTPGGLAYEKIERDEACWARMLPKLRGFYFEHMLPVILGEV